MRFHWLLYQRNPGLLMEERHLDRILKQYRGRAAPILWIITQAALAVLRPNQFRHSLFSQITRIGAAMKIEE